MKNKTTGMNLLICGSQKFEEEEFVFKTLEILFAESHGNIRRIFTSKFSGSCEFARKWVSTKNEELSPDSRIEIVDFAFDGFLEKRNQVLYDNLEIPAYAVQNDPFFQKGKEMLISKGVNLVLAFPNKEGILGASTRNIGRFADLAQVKIFDCSLLFAKIKEHNMQNQVTQEATRDEVVEPSMGFNNRHPSKR